MVSLHKYQTAGCGWLTSQLRNCLWFLIKEKKKELRIASSSGFHSFCFCFKQGSGEKYVHLWLAIFKSKEQSRFSSVCPVPGCHLCVSKRTWDSDVWSRWGCRECWRCSQGTVGSWKGMLTAMLLLRTTTIMLMTRVTVIAVLHWVLSTCQAPSRA